MVLNITSVSNMIVSYIALTNMVSYKTILYVLTGEQCWPRGHYVSVGSQCQPFRS